MLSSFRSTHVTCAPKRAPSSSSALRLALRGAMATQTTGAEATSAPRGGMSLDAAALLRYMRGAMGAALPPRTQALRVRQFGHGQSNPTYLLECVADAASASRPDAPALASFVLRKKPPGKLLASAHAVEREYAVLDALRRAAPDVPVPAVFALCSDAAVIGTPFYIMQHVVGRCARSSPANTRACAGAASGAAVAP